MAPSLVVYGAYGYTGELVAREAAARGLPVVLAGRDSERLARLGRALGRPWRAFPLTDPEALRAGLQDAGAVLHCAGPYVDTWRPMAEACLEARVHYLDLAGEAGVYRALAAMGLHAERAGVMLLSGAAFDVVPTDCLAAHVARRLPGAVRIAIAIDALGSLSRGTARTVVAHAGDADARELNPHQPAARTFDLGSGRLQAVQVPWPERVAVPRSTGVEDVAVYLCASQARRVLLRAVPAVAPLLALPGARALAVRLLTGGAAGPDAEARARGRSRVYAEAVDAAGARAAARLALPEGYAFTAHAAVEIAARALAGYAPPGWQTPASAYGPELVTALPGVTLEDLPLARAAGG
ncbi:saccharopine dehydrogenase family protein [Anaeromyxobacter sp. Red801]|uniref:saccharopine dehydrogenase family protein n=1 Tax=Anaeromyxobacter sp. Red801 TaxID=3411632 RepID=UPI003BA13DFE